MRPGAGMWAHERAYDMSEAQTSARVVLIAGPTASGKSALALALAERTGGIVVNADSMQVYGDLRVITARPTPAEEARAPHRLYGHVDAAVNYSVGQYLADAGRALDEARRVLRPGGRLHVADWGAPQDPVMRAAFLALRALDGFERTRVHARGELPSLIEGAGFSTVRRHDRLRTGWGTLELLSAEPPLD